MRGCWRFGGGKSLKRGAISVNVYTIPRLTHPNVESSKFEDVYNLLIIAINVDEYLIRVFNSTTNMETTYKFAKNYR